MKKNHNKIWICIIITLLACVGCQKQNKIDTNNQKTVNLNSGVINAKIIDGYKLENASLSSKDNNSTFIVFITNIGEDTSNISQVKATMKDEQENEITSVYLNVNKQISPDESIELSAVFSMNLMNVTTITYEIIK